LAVCVISAVGRAWRPGCRANLGGRGSTCPAGSSGRGEGSGWSAWREGVQPGDRRGDLGGSGQRAARRSRRRTMRPATAKFLVAVIKGSHQYDQIGRAYRSLASASSATWPFSATDPTRPTRHRSPHARRSQPSGAYSSCRNTHHGDPDVPERPHRKQKTLRSARVYVSYAP
jgi:hypothetical protein